MDGFLRSQGIRLVEAAQVPAGNARRDMREPVVYEDSGTQDSARATGTVRA